MLAQVLRQLLFLGADAVWILRSRPIPQDSDLRFHLQDQLRQLFLTFLPRVAIYIAGMLLAVWPDGKKHSRNVYGHTREECEEKLAKLILQMKAEIAVLRNGTAAEYPDGVSPKKKQLAEYLRQHPGVSNKSYIARETGMDRTTVQKYYDEVRAELAAPANT